MATVAPMTDLNAILEGALRRSVTIKPDAPQLSMGSDPSPTMGGVSHQVAVRAATALITDAHRLGLPWADMAFACETMVAIVVAMATDQAKADDPVAFAADLVDVIAHRAKARVTALLQGDDLP